MELTPFECYNYLKQEYLICITVHKARNLCVFNADTYVKVTVDKKYKTTSVYKNSENPFFNEYFVFELYCTFPELLRLTVLFEVKRKTCCMDTNIGELFVDLATVWNQQGHQFYKKWGKLENPVGKTSNKPRGHLQIDLSIVSKTEAPAPAVSQQHDYDDIENNLLLIEDDENKTCNVRYHITFYSGIFMKKSDYLIQITFAGMNAKTRPVKSTQYPEWNELIKFNWYYPSLTKIFFIQIMYREFLQWKCISDYEIHIDEICFPGSPPALGPTFIHFYDPLDSHNYIGKLLLEIKTEYIGTLVPSAKRDVTKLSVPPINEHIFWNDENFIIEALIWQGDFIHHPNASNIKVTIKCGGWESSIVELHIHSYELSNFKYFEQEIPHKATTLNTYFPDCREKIYPDLIMSDFIYAMKIQLENYKALEIRTTSNRILHAKCLKALISIFERQIREIKSKINYNGHKKLTQWDKNLRRFLFEFLENTIRDFREYRKKLRSKTKNSLDNIEITYKNLLVKIKEIETFLSTRIQDNLPDLILNLWADGSPVAYCKLDAKNFIYSKQSHFCGRLCGKRHMIIFKPLTCPHTCEFCGCIYAKVDGWIWIGTAMEHAQRTMHNGWISKESNYVYDFENEIYFNCNVYLHQAKIRPGNDVLGLCDPKLRVTFLNCQQESNVVYKTLSPVWNEMITFENICFPGSVENYIENPPLVAIELYDVDENNSSDYLGCTLLRLAVKPINVNVVPLQVIYDKVRPKGGMESEPVEEVKEIDNMKDDDFVKKVLESNDDDDDDIDDGYNDENILNDVDIDNEKLEGEILSNVPIIETKIAMEKLKNVSKLFPPPLKWYPIASDGAVPAEILISGELIEIDTPQKEGKNDVLINIEVYENIPKEILPIMKRYKFELFFVGIRNWHKTLVLSPGRYKMKCIFGDLVLYSGPCKTKMNHNFNFMDPYMTGLCMLPEQLEYWPPIIFVHVETISKKSRETTIGAALVSDSHKYLESGKNICELESTRSSSFFSSSNLNVLSRENTPLIKTKKKLISKIENLQIFQSTFGKLQEIFSYRVEEIAKKLSLEDTSSKNTEKEDYTWWTKFYCSLKSNDDENNHNHSSSKDKHKLEVYGSELEKQPEFSYFQDWAEPIHMIRGVKKRKNRPPQDESYCTFKYNIKIKSCEIGGTSLTGNISEFKILNTKYDRLNDIINETRVFVRVYIVRGLNLRSHDAYSQADPFLKLQFGSQKINDRLNYLQNQANPIFGKRFEFEGVIPKEHILHISVYDRGCIDDLIGCTCIDMEDRLRSKHRAGIGISREFSTSGYNAWRGYSSPKDILAEICIKNGLRPPTYHGNKIEVDGVKFEDSTIISKNEDIRERLSLSALKRLDEIPSLGYKLVPEHVETRSLFRNDRPGVEQGKLQMWVEIYEHDKIPYPIDITPLSAKNYELRAIIWNTSDVILDEENIFGNKMSDIYLKGWLQDSSQAQYTDIHYRSLNGEGNFNWRMVFPLKYSKTEEMMVITKKGSSFERYDDEVKIPPIFYIQIWDNDTVSADDFLGSLEINLSNFLKPPNTAKKCTLPSEKESAKMKHQNKEYIDLFAKKRVKGWFPATGTLSDGSIGLTGKVELELKIVSEEEADANPVGLGREPPHSLPMPKRPPTSFSWFTNPLQSLKYIILPFAKKICLKLGIILLVIIVIYGIIASIPNSIFQSISPIE